MKVGDKLKVARKTSNHCFLVGSIIELTRVSGNSFVAKGISENHGKECEQVVRPEDLEPLSLYETLQDTWVKAVGLKVGDYVKVNEKTKPFWWENSWVSDMDSYIGGTYKVKYINYNGVGLYGLGFPFTSLERVEPPVQSVSLGDVVAVLADGTVTIGQTKLTFKDFDNLVGAVNVFRNS